jgi:hypothetical protein
VSSRNRLVLVNSANFADYRSVNFGMREFQKARKFRVSRNPLCAAPFWPLFFPIDNETPPLRYPRLA